MKQIVVINPNTSATTTAMMTALVCLAVENHPAFARQPGIAVSGLTAVRGVPMILDRRALEAAAEGVVAMGRSVAGKADGLIVAAFGDPGLEALRRSLDIPVAGLCEASMLEAAAGGRRFGIATVTPDLVEGFADTAVRLGLGAQFAGTRLTPGDPLALARDPERLAEALADAVRQSQTRDGAEVVIIGGGPLGQAAATLQAALSIPVIAPIASAVARLLVDMKAAAREGRAR